MSTLFAGCHRDEPPKPQSSAHTPNTQATLPPGGPNLAAVPNPSTVTTETPSIADGSVPGNTPDPNAAMPGPTGSTQINPSSASAN